MTLLSSSTVFVFCRFHGLFHVGDCHLLKEDNFSSSLPIWLNFISCPFLNELARISSTMLNRKDVSGCICLIPDLREKAFSLSH